MVKIYSIIDKRSTGKTSRLLLLAKENNGVVVCNNPSAMKDKAYTYGLVGIDFLSYEQYIFSIINGDSDYDNKPIFIDELELFLKKINYNIKGFTMTEGDNSIL